MTHNHVLLGALGYCNFPATMHKRFDHRGDRRVLWISMIPFLCARVLFCHCCRSHNSMAELVLRVNGLISITAK